MQTKCKNIIILITEYDQDLKQTIVSHGIDYITNKPIVLPWVTPQNLGAIFSTNIGHWIIYD